jgi:hypothetical protein
LESTQQDNSKEIKELTTAKETVEGQVTTLQAEIAKLTSEQQTRKDEITKLTGEVSLLTTAKETAERQAGTKQTEIDKLKLVQQECESMSDLDCVNTCVVEETFKLAPDISDNGELGKISKVKEEGIKTMFLPFLKINLDKIVEFIKSDSALYADLKAKL